MTNATTKQTAPTPIRLPGHLKDWLKKEAERNHRSLNGEVLMRLAESKASAEKATAQGAGHTKSRL